MPQLQSIVLTDRESVPVNHTFVPRDIREGVGTVIESLGTPIGEPKLAISLRKLNGKYRGRLVLDVPVVVTETINGVNNPMIARRAVADLTIVFDEKSSLQERKNLVGMLASALDSSKVLVNDSFTKLEGVY